jgi:hypothetical protein
MLLESGNGSFDDVALPVAHRIDQGRAATPGAPAGSEGLLVGALRDGVGDPPLPQQPPTRGVAVAAVSDQVRRALAWSPRPWPGHSDGIQQWLQLGALMALTGGDQHRQWPTAAVAGQVDLGGQPAATAAEGLVAVGIGA